MNRQTIATLVCLAVMGGVSASVSFDETLFQKWSDRYTHLEGLDLFEPQIRVGGGRSQQCQPCVQEATEFTLRKAVEEFAEMCQQARNPRFQKVCEVAREDKKFALGMLLEKLNPVKLAFAYCAGRQSCNEERSEQTRNQELNELLQINLVEVLREVQGQTLQQLKRIPQFDVEVFEGMKPVIEEMKQTLMGQTGAQFEKVSRQEIERECSSQQTNLFRHNNRYNRGVDLDNEDEDDVSMKYQKKYNKKYNKQYNKKYENQKYENQKYQNEDDTDFYQRKYNKKFQDELEDDEDQTDFYQRKYNKKYNQKYQDDMENGRFLSRVETRYQPATRFQSTQEKCECTQCIKKTDVNVMKQVALKVKEICQQSQTPATRRFCEVTEQEPEVTIGFLVSKVEPWKYAVGYCRALDLCSEMGVQEGRQQLIMA